MPSPWLWAVEQSQVELPEQEKMKKSAFFIIAAISSHLACYAQQASDSTRRWEVNADVNFYFLPGDFFLLPVIKADKGKLHLETRYNYEDRQTFSAWAGYNFTGGKQVQYAITPMGGGVFGRSNGVAVGLEFTVSYRKWEVASESEYLFEFASKENDFYYQWIDLSFSPKDWLWLGISGQRTKLYQTKLDVQRGLMAGVGFRNFGLTAYLYNLGFDDPFTLITVSAEF